MNNTLIIGPADAHKTYAARLLARGMVATYHNRAEHCATEGIPEFIIPKGTQLLIIDDVHLSALSDLAKSLYQAEEPEIIMICTCDLFEIPWDAEFHSKFRVFLCGKDNSTGVAMILVNPEIFTIQSKLNF